MHESLIAVLRRRFVSTYYNAFPSGLGADPAAARFVQGASGLGAVGGPRYGLILTPEGEALVSFGYGRAEFTAALRRVMRTHPDWMQPTAAERAVLAAADGPDASAEAHLAAAHLQADLLDDAAARRHLAAALAAGPSPATAARVHWFEGHLAAIDLDRRDPEGCRAAFAKIGPVPADLADDVGVDLVSLDLRLRPAQGFFTGWAFAPGTDLAAHRATLERLIATYPRSERIGEMHFYLGLARYGLGDREGANATWKRHYETWPEDRFAMLSRIHHTGYRFSPFKYGPDGPPGGVISTEDLANDPERIRQLLEALERGGAEVRGSGPGGVEMMKRMLKRMLERAAAREKAKEGGTPKGGDAPKAPGEAPKKESQAPKGAGSGS